MANRLAGATSPYLLQHANNPVDWFEWGDDAFAEARRRDLPILLSVGYAACHWCHVMAHESFEDPITASLMNDMFVAIKVDREERPDVDAVYMDAVTAMTGHGGWPMTAFLTHSGAPFYAGTYFPPTPGRGMPSFRQVLSAVSETWRERRDDVESQASAIVSRLDEVRVSEASAADSPPDLVELDAAATALMKQYDFARGGFGDAPKFPPSMVLEFLLRHHARTGDPDSLLMVSRTCQAMARGGIYDQLAGGFARYSVDAGWVVPHFEKMLYDNALLARVYLHLWRATGSAFARRIAEETADFMVKELATAEGGFASALDADSEGVEGRYYVWSIEELVAVLGDDDATFAAEALVVTFAGTFEQGSSTLQLPRDASVDARARLDVVRAKLLAAREKRVRPARDDKVVAAWNGLAIAALAEIGFLLDRPDLLDAARRAAELLLEVHVVDGDRLLRVSRTGTAGPHLGVLEDYGDVAEGLHALFATTGETRWLTEAGVLVDAALRRFRSPGGGFFDTAEDATPLVRRPRDPTDGATPSGLSSIASSLLTQAAYTGRTDLRDAAGEALASAAGLAAAPRFAGWLLSTAEAWADGPREVAVVGPLDDPATRALWRASLLGTAPGAVVAAGTSSAVVPLLDNRPGGSPQAYVCRRFVCHAPTADPATVAAMVGGHPGT
jgi:uncharacterized protein YyaL (SSP411 family)